MGKADRHAGQHPKLRPGVSLVGPYRICITPRCQKRTSERQPIPFRMQGVQAHRLTDMLNALVVLTKIGKCYPIGSSGVRIVRVKGERALQTEFFIVELPQKSVNRCQEPMNPPVTRFDASA